jgi:two-component system, NarL family, nitrate/nitrite response regulator NarL
MASPPARVTVRVAVQSARRLFRDSLAGCLSALPDVTVVGKVAEPDGLPGLCELARPDVVILDAESRLGELATRAGRLLQRFPELNVIVAYREASERDLALACRAGVTSLVPESHGLAAVLALLRRRPAPHAQVSQGSLTDRELELVVLTGSGHSVAEMAELLGVSPPTVENLKRRLYAKLGVNSSAQAASRAASLGLLDRHLSPAVSQPAASGEFSVLTVVSGKACPALDQLASALIASSLAFVLTGRPGPVADSHWADWHRGPIVVVLVDPEPTDWNLINELGVPAVVVHSRPLAAPELADALARGADSLLPAGKIDDHFVPVLRMVSKGYIVVSSLPMRPLIRAGHARYDQRVPGSRDLPELAAREGDILASIAQGDSIRQTARMLGIAPKTVENTQTRLFRKLGVSNRAGALAVAAAFGLLPESPRFWPNPPAGSSAPSGSPGQLRQPEVANQRP